jgi:hypothetical protein
MPLNTQIYLITIVFGGRQVEGGSYADLVERSASDKKKSAKVPPYPPSKEHTAELETKPAVVPKIIKL